MKLRLLGVIILALALSACGNNKQNETQTTAVKADAPKIYQNFCISCHGNQLQGGQGPNIQKVGERLDEAQIIKRIQKGGGGMPPFQVALKEEELKALASWLAGLK
ncbi:cytochrome c551 [Paenibacillus sp. yr247]|uniref:c-type cytochrome n=1 Tax=Paenibacillus sp. yr247 TaxID=1761880 RepID=UPI00088E3125|nr:cytochrome c [Paenibacillus sp. yr247]SDN38127.1 cytochrome c551 [Paenibacillus sp. yr247]